MRPGEGAGADGAGPDAARPAPAPDVGAEVLRRRGLRLEWATIAWNSMEVFVTVGLGIAAGSLALVAFGLDSLVEVFASLVVVWHMADAPDADREGRNRRAMRLVGVAFAVLAVYLFVASIRSIVIGAEAAASPWGIAYLGVTAVVMFGLARAKHRTAAALGSGPLRAEASMTFLDGCLATGVLSALAMNALAGWWWADPLAAGLLGLFSAREAWESWHDAGST